MTPSLRDRIKTWCDGMEQLADGEPDNNTTEGEAYSLFQEVLDILPKEE